MSLAPGTRLGPYEITTQIGVGGMGEVYRATDTNLARQVAIKVLPEAFAHDPERLARFEREAKTLASLNHPHIAQIHGLEKSGGTIALVMELVEGPTLAERIEGTASDGPLGERSGQGPKTRAQSLERSRGVPLDEALAIAKQIAEALEAAHERGIIHRDLKPANIKVREDGMVKVLDFGLAKALTPDPVADLSNSPTLSMAATQAGMILGTAGYMSPEQARGKPVDKRADVWAFGCVLYEMLTGKRAFAGEDVTDTLAAVVRSEPAWDALPSGLSPTLVVYLKRCLHKDAKQRVHDIADMRLALEGAFDGAAGSAGSEGQDPAYVRTQVDAAVADVRQALARSTRQRVLFVGAVTAAAIGAAVGAAVWYAMRPAPLRLVRTEITTSGASALSLQGTVPDLAITPDGSRIVYRGQNQLLVRALDQLTPTPLTDLGAPRGPFVSPDGQWVGFFDSTNLKKVALAGGPPVTLAGSVGNGSGGATWGDDGTIVFASNSPVTGLQQVSAAGGEPTVLTTPNREGGEGDHYFPEFLPGGQAVLFTIMPVTGSLDNAQIAVLDLRTNTQTVLVRGGSHARYVPSGHLVYGAGGTLRAVAFDLARLAVIGTPVPVLEQVTTTATGAVDAVVSANGTLVYVAGGTVAGAQRSLVWVDRMGREEPLPAPARAYMYPRLSPDGTRVAVHGADQEQDLWVWDLARATLTRLTFEPGTDLVSAWTPDSRRILFSSQRAGGVRNLFMQPADGTGSAVRLTESNNNQDPTGITADGTRVILNEVTPTQQRDLRILTLEPPRPATPATGPERAPAEPPRVAALIETRFEERGGIVSPDGRWLAYESNSSGQFEIYVRPFPNVGDGQWQVSSAGGAQALWAPNGRELFFIAPDGALMTVPVDPRSATWSAGTATKLVEGRYFTGGGVNLSRQYDVTPDGQRFLMIKERDANDASAPLNLTVVLNWTEDLKRLVPVN